MPAMLAAPMIALGLTIVTSLGLFAALGKPAGQALYSLLLEPFDGWYNLSEVLLKTGAFMLIAQGLAIGFRANFFNIGAEGQWIIGAICASALPTDFPVAGVFVFQGLLLVFYPGSLTFIRGLPSQLLASVPYAVTILMRTLISSNRRRMRLNTVASLGQPFYR